jgi:hypothetical protein
MGQSQRSHELAEGIEHDKPANEGSKAIGQLDAELVLPGDNGPRLGTDQLVDGRLTVVRRVEIIDLAGQEPIPPPNQETDSATDFEKSEQFQYSGHA